MVDKLSLSRPILYFEQNGRANLSDVIKCIRRSIRRRDSLRSLKLVFFTALGEGPILATSRLREFQPKIIAVTFPPKTVITRGEEKFKVEIPKEVARYLKALDVDILSTRLPFDAIISAPDQTASLKLIVDTLSIVCSSLPLAVQAVLQACDFGLLEEGEEVIAVTGDCAAIISASSSKRFLTPESQFFIKEFLCKPLTKERPIIRKQVEQPKKLSSNHKTLEGSR